MKNIASRKSPLKALAFFLSISSLVGTSSMPATAEEATWDLTVEIVDTGCNEDITRHHGTQIPKLPMDKTATKLS
jgi:hypothetical protein